MADFWGGFGQGFSKQAGKSWERAADKRDRRDEREEDRKVRATELKDLRDERAALEASRIAQMEAAVHREKELREGGWRARAKALDAKVKEDMKERGTFPEAFQAEVPEGGLQLPSIPVKGESWLAAALEGEKLEKVEAELRGTKAQKGLATFSSNLSAIGQSLQIAGQRKDTVFDDVQIGPDDDGELLMSVPFQKMWFERGRNSKAVGDAKAERVFLDNARQELIKAGAGLSTWGLKPKKITSDKDVFDSYAEISSARKKKSLYEVQQQVFGTPPNLTPMGKPEIIGLPIGEVDGHLRKWAEALETQRIEKIGNEARAKHEATTLTPEKEVEREQKILQLQEEGKKPFYGWKNVRGEWDMNPEYIPDFTEWSKKVRRSPTEWEWNEAKEEMALSGATVHEPPEPNWRKLLPQPQATQPPQPTQPPRSDLYDPNIPREGARLSKDRPIHRIDPLTLPTLKESPRGVADTPATMSIDDAPESLRRMFLAKPENKPFEDSNGVRWVRKRNKLYRVK